MEQLDAESLFQFAALFGNGLLAQIQALNMRPPLPETLRQGGT